MAKNTDKTKKKPQKRNKNSASMEELLKETQASGNVYGTPGASASSGDGVQGMGNGAAGTAGSAGAAKKQSTGQTAYRRKSSHRPGMSAALPDVEKPSAEEEFATKPTVSFYDAPAGKSSKAKNSARTSNPHITAVKGGAADPDATQAMPSIGASAAQSVAQPTSSSRPAAKPSRPGKKSRPVKRSVPAAAPQQSPEEEFASKPTVSFYDADESGAAEDEIFDPYAAADAAFDAGYVDDDVFADEETQAMGSVAAGSTTAMPAASSSQVPPKPTHPSLRYRLASVALGKKAAVNSDDPNDQPKSTKPSGRSIVMPTGGKKGAVNDFVEAVSEKRPVIDRGRIIAIVVWSLIALMIVLSLVFFWNRWWRYDDVLDVQGTWSANNSSTDIILNDRYMQLTDDVLYIYEIDPFSKTITYEFGTTKGQGRYRFSFDRNELIITDGDYSWLSTLQEDIPWTLETLWKNLTKTPLASPLGDENVAVLKRVSRDKELTKTPKTDEEMAIWRQEQREAAAKAEEEAMSGGNKTVYSVTEGVPIEKPSEEDKADASAGSDTSTSDGTDETWQDAGNTWDDGSGQWDQSYDQSYDTSWDQNYDYGYDQGYDTGYDQSYDYGYDTGYDTSYDQNYNQGYDTSWDTGGYDQGYDTGWDTGTTDQGYDATGYDTTGDQTYVEGY